MSCAAVAGPGGKCFRWVIRPTVLAIILCDLLCAATADAQEGMSMRRLPPVDSWELGDASNNRWRDWQFELEEPQPQHEPFAFRPPNGNRRYRLSSWDSNFAGQPSEFQPPQFDNEEFIDPPNTATDGYQPEMRLPVFTGLPKTLLWEIPLANQREPRMFGKFTNLHGDLTFETAIGAELGICRLSPTDLPNEGIQLDFFAVAFTRFSNDWVLMTTDFRVGIPLTFASGPWQGKLAFEHTSTHLGDEYIELTGQLNQSHVHDEIVLGLARRFPNNIRLYGQYAYSFVTSRMIRDDRSRFDWGVEWHRLEWCFWGRPFAAFDMDLRSGQNYTANITFQYGWQWRADSRGRSARVAFEYYSGKSPYGQFYRDRESWIGLSILYDW